MNGKAGMPNVILIVLDAARADHLSCYGYSRKTTPNIDKIAEDGLLFENAFSAASWTPPSHASIFTGMYPSQHGVLGKNLYLDEEILSVAEIFSSKGYETLGICENIWVSSQTGLDRGFKKFISRFGYFDRFSHRLSLDWIIFSLGTDIRSMAYNWGYQTKVFQAIKKWILNSQKMNKPFFIFVNYFDAHTPYNPPQPFKRKFEIIRNRNINMQKIRDVFNSRHGYPYVAEEIEVSEEEWDVLKSWYDGEIAYIDFFLGQLFECLKERELFDSTIVVITSDHGENFGEHQLANHLFCLYDTLLHIPLIIRYSDFASGGKRISSLVSNIDIFPTLLEILNMEAKSNTTTSARVHTSGVSLIPSENGVYHNYICAEHGPPVADIKALKRLSPNVNSSICNKYNRSLKCIRSTDFKFIMASDGEEELYNLEKDPEEHKNVISEFPEKAKELRSLLTAELKCHLNHPIKKRTHTFDDEMRERLQELGYF